ncbi:hypothetical protein PGIGA_G00132700 [Pangasianodon gigas]|uniref:Uncharacterized protein n=1 Tax=Pangasianodon gigas TaxID=30993 RepID=A0ACC5XKJ5_PANGG|nr:hypothetical protein [Pangasianodon gigas]
MVQSILRRSNYSARRARPGKLRLLSDSPARDRRLSSAWTERPLPEAKPVLLTFRKLLYWREKTSATCSAPKGQGDITVFVLFLVHIRESKKEMSQTSWAGLLERLMQQISK